MHNLLYQLVLIHPHQQIIAYTFPTMRAINVATHVETYVNKGKRKREAKTASKATDQAYKKQANPKNQPSHVGPSRNN